MKITVSKTDRVHNTETTMAVSIEGDVLELYTSRQTFSLIKNMSNFVSDAIKENQ